MILCCINVNGVRDWENLNICEFVVKFRHNGKKVKKPESVYYEIHKDRLRREFGVERVLELFRIARYEYARLPENEKIRYMNGDTIDINPLLWRIYDHLISIGSEKRIEMWKYLKNVNR